MYSIEKVKQIIIAHKRLFSILGFLLICFFILQVLNSHSPSSSPGSFSPTITLIPVQPSYSVVETSPVNGATNVSTGEIDISFTTDREIVSPNSFHMTITPALPYYWKFTNSYPTRNITARVLGYLQPSTLYTVSVTDASKNPEISWSFTTTATPSDSSSGLVIDQEQQFVNKLEPLWHYTPYETTDFETWYKGPLHLVVQQKIADKNKIQRELFSWMKSHGVGPTTHTYEYIPNQ